VRLEGSGKAEEKNDLVGNRTRDQQKSSLFNKDNTFLRIQECYEERSVDHCTFREKVEPDKDVFIMAIYFYLHTEPSSYLLYLACPEMRQLFLHKILSIRFSNVVVTQNTIITFSAFTNMTCTTI
jgi:hypothetical protein